MPRNIIPCTILCITRYIIIVWCIITRCIILCITRYIIKTKNPKHPLRVFFYR